MERVWNGRGVVSITLGLHRYPSVRRRDGKPALCRMLVCPDDLNVLENFVYGDTPATADGGDQRRSLAQDRETQRGTSGDIRQPPAFGAPPLQHHIA